ncbi:cytochrome C oxidase subunit II [Halalkalibacter alkalisediminis]|uniref:Cytochrome C oxidase subunit II n=1 Tax=Halalkalibacter alkalisediminis TaxID=935616 RepID=A0ABV6ND94_9BACI|nr:cytochrome C oxidase subunit II [Halalkalibacter alkalisediminis]
MKKLFITGVSILLIGSLVACAGSSDEPATTKSEEASTIESGSTIVLEASNWKFDQEEYKVSAGEVTIQLKNVEGYHGVEIEGADLKIDGDGEQTVTLAAGEYIIYCSIPCGGDHDKMTAKLIVE